MCVCVYSLIEIDRHELTEIDRKGFFVWYFCVVSFSLYLFLCHKLYTSHISLLPLLFRMTLDKLQRKKKDQGSPDIQKDEYLFNVFLSPTSAEMAPCSELRDN